MTRYSYLSELRCSRCSATYALAQRVNRCPCGGILLASYDLVALQRDWSPAILSQRSPSLWRYHELLPIREQAMVVSLQEPMTPLMDVPALAQEIDIPGLLVKDEGRLPSATFKARGAAIGVSMTKELGFSKMVMGTNGNAGAAWALYAARAGIPIRIHMPANAPETPRRESELAGAEVSMVQGTIADASRAAEDDARAHGWYNVSTFQEPYRVEGKKTMGFEIAEQFGWHVPDVIVYPTGGGAGVIGIFKAVQELQAIGWMGSKMPRFAIVQASGCAPLVQAHEQGLTETQPWPNPSTIAYGMRVPKPAADSLLLETLQTTNGTAVSVSDEEIAKMHQLTVRKEGLHVCPEGAAAFAGARKLRVSNWIRDGETVLVINTGSGLKNLLASPSDVRA